MVDIAPELVADITPEPIFEFATQTITASISRDPISEIVDDKPHQQAIAGPMMCELAPKFLTPVTLKPRMYQTSPSFQYTDNSMEDSDENSSLSDTDFLDLGVEEQKMADDRVAVISTL